MILLEAAGVLCFVAFALDSSNKINVRTLLPYQFLSVDLSLLTIEMFSYIWVSFCSR